MGDNLLRGHRSNESEHRLALGTCGEGSPKGRTDYIYFPFFNDDTGKWDVIEDKAIAVEINERGSWSVCDGGGFRHRLGSDAFLTEGEAIKEAENEQRKAD